MVAAPFRIPPFSLTASFSLLAAACGLMPSAQGADSTQPASRPNVLLICVDDLRPELGIYGVQRAVTPNLDRLGKQGIVFDRAYCQQAVCSPSRISMLTGLRPDSTGIYDLNTRIADKMPQWRTMPQAFRETGYETVAIGKIYHHFRGQKADDPKGWSKPPINAEGEWWGRGYLRESGRAQALDEYGVQLPPGSTARDLPVKWSAYTSPEYRVTPEDLQAALAAANPATVLARHAEAELRGNRVDLHAIFPEAGHAEGHEALLTTRMTLSEPATLSIGASADWRMQWFVNGKPAFATLKGNGTTSFGLTNHVFQVQLPAGESRLDVLVGSGTNGWVLHAGSGSALEGAVQAFKRTYKEDRGAAWEMADVADDAYPDGKNMLQAQAELKRFKEEKRPFFLAVGLLKPHLPFNAPKRYWDLYDPSAIALPSTDKPVGTTKFAFQNSGELRAYVGMPKRDEPFTEEQARSLIHGYLAATSYADACIGQLLNSLEELGLAENTIVVLWGDHGWKLGEYGEWCKHTNMELDTRIPLMLKAPGVTTPGARTAALVESIDIFPTLCELTGVAPTPEIEGQSLVLLAQDPERKWDEVAYMQYPRGKDVMGYAVRSHDYRLIQWKHVGSKEVLAEELYDHRTETLEMRNVAGAPEYRAALEVHRQHLADWPVKR